MIRRTTWIALGIFILLLAAAFIWQRYQKNEEAEITPTAEEGLLLHLTTKITDLRIEGVGSQIVEVAQDEQGQWKLIIPEGHETDTGAVEGAVSQLPTLRILSTFDQSLDLGGAGLVVPTYRILITMEDGQQFVVDVGRITSTGSGYYVRTGGKDVYVVSTYSLDSILNLVKSPPIKPTPTPPAETEILPAETVTTPVSTETLSIETSTPASSIETPASTSTP